MTTAETSRPLPPLLVFADDWGRHPSSAQHLIRRLLPRRQVRWVNTIGTRKPRLDLETFRRGMEKLRQWRRGGTPTTEPLPDNLRVINPRMWPWFSHVWDRALNRRLLVKALRPVVEALPEPPIVITTLPITADLIGAIPARRWVYYCVDDFSVWPGLDGSTLRRLESRMLSKVDQIIAVSENLQERLKGLGRSSELLTHGVDLEFWENPGEELSPRFTELPRPLMVFWGVVDRRMDSKMVRRLADERLGTVLLVGPHANPDPDLLAVPVVAPGPMPMRDLPALARLATVLIMPYADLPVTRAIQPLKLKEYLATGLPVVATDLPANRAWADSLDLVTNAEEFVSMVRRRVDEGISAEQRFARRRLVSEGWTEKARQFEEWLGP